MQTKFNYGAIISILLVMVLIVGGFWSYSANSDLKSSLSETSKSLVDTQTQNTQLTQSVSQLQNTILELQKPTEAVTPIVTTEIETPKTGYLIDEINISNGISETLSDKEINLFDGKVEFDDEDYNIDEYLILNGLDLTANKKDFNSDVYSVVKEDNVEYKVTFDNKLVKENISEDTPLTFNFLGQEVEVTKWNSNSITIRYGNEQRLSEGSSVNIDGKNVKAEFISRDSVYFDVDGVAKTIKSGQTTKVNGIQISVSDVWYSENKVSSVTFRAGDSIKDTFNSGDEYAKDSIWDWKINDSSIGVVLSEDFKYLDKDNKPLSANEVISLPNGYKTIQFNGINDVEYTDVSFRVKSNGDMKISGNGFNLLVKNGTLYDDDNDENVTTYEIDGTDLSIKIVNDSVVVYEGNKTYLSIPFNVTSVTVDGSNEKLEQEDDYRSVYGIVIKNTEDISEDQELSVSIPSEQVQGSFLVY